MDIENGWEIRQGDALTLLRAQGEATVDCVVTSPPYWGLRDYGVDGQLGLEAHPTLYLEHLWGIMDEVYRVLKPSGVCFVNLGDTYGTIGGDLNKRNSEGINTGQKAVVKAGGAKGGNRTCPKGDPWLRPKQLLLIPSRFAIGMQERRWLLRNDIVWCLSGGTHLYVRSQKGDMPMTVKDLARLRPDTVQLWNGQKWVRLLGMSRMRREGDQLELVLRSGERISCTPNHKFPSDRGLLEAADLRKGDRLWRVRLPEPTGPKAAEHIGLDAAWFVGLYLAEGSRAGETIQLSGHAKENERWVRLQRIARAYGGSITRTVHGNNMDIRMYGKLLAALIDQFITGRTAIDKGLSAPIWQYDDAFLEQVLLGYLSGDGHWDEKSERWRIGFCRNYKWERDLRTLCARLGYSLVLNLATAKHQGGQSLSFRGEIRFNGRKLPTEEVVAIRRGKCLSVYDLGVEDDPHTFALASGILTHNSKPNAMPSSVQDRFSNTYEHVFLFVKQERYWFALDDVRESVNEKERREIEVESHTAWKNDAGVTCAGVHPLGKNPGDTWRIPTAPFPEAHFATFPPDLPRRAIRAGCPVRVCAECGVPWKREVEVLGESTTEKRKRLGESKKRGAGGVLVKQNIDYAGGHRTNGRERTPGPWHSACKCGDSWQPGLVLDPFAGSGTTGMMAVQEGRRFLGFELSEEYCQMARRRIGASQAPLMIEV
jgi:DNA modification methylase